MGSWFQVRSRLLPTHPAMTMQDVSQDSLDLLHRMEHPKHRYRCLVNFHWYHWGRCNGARVTFTDSGASHTVDCIVNSFEVAHQPLLLVRKSYINLWDHLRATYLESDDNDPYHRATIVYGHPGIGKTVSLYYLMCAAAEARIPFVFHRAGSGAAFVCLAAGAFFVPAILVPVIDFLKRALVLIDAAGLLAPDVYDLGPFAHVVLATSQAPAPGRYKGLVKDRNARFSTMGLPSLAEFRAILSLRRPGVRYVAVPLLGTDHAVLDVPPSDLDDMSRLNVDLDSDGGAPLIESSHQEYWDPLTVFEYCGPNLRTALAPHPRVIGNPLELLGPSNVFDNACFHTFFFERPDPNMLVTLRPPSNLVIPTRFLRGVAYAAVRRAQPAQQVELISRVRRASGAVHNMVFEAAMLSYLPTARIVADLPSLATSLVISPHPQPRAYVVCPSPTPVLVTTPAPALLACTANAEGGVESIPDQLGFCALPAGSASAHALMLAEDSSGRRYEILFHVTVSELVSKARPIAKADIDSLVQALGRHSHTHPPRRLFLFVSDMPEKGLTPPGADAYPALSGWEIGCVTVSDHDLLSG